MELGDDTLERIEALSEEGNALVEADRLDEAIRKYREALDLIPDPVDQCETSSWLQVSIGDTFFLKKDYGEAIENFLDALNCADQIDNAFVYLRLGQAYFELNDLERAKENLLKAYMLEDREIFEDEDEKYFDVIKSISPDTADRDTSADVISPDTVHPDTSADGISSEDTSLEDRLFDLEERSYTVSPAESVRLMLQAWAIIPEPKVNLGVSYHVAKRLINSYLDDKKYNEAKEWSKLIYRCSPNRIDSGERDFLAGKVDYEMGNLDQAKEHFLVANKKSRGRCFIDEDKKYKSLIK